MVALNLVNRPNKRKQVPEQVSELTTNRLSVYLRCLNELEDAGVQTISSQALAEQFAHGRQPVFHRDVFLLVILAIRGCAH